jgi:hypothetical protein
MSDNHQDNLSASLARLFNRLIILADHDTELAAELRTLAANLASRFGATQPAEIAPIEPLSLEAAMPVEVDVRTTPTLSLEAVTPAEVEAPSLAPPTANVPPVAPPFEAPAVAPLPVDIARPAYGLALELGQVADDDLPVIARRCELKAAAARARAAWLRESESSESARPLDMRALIAEAKKLPDSFLWMADRWRLEDATSYDLDTLADSFGALDEALGWIVALMNSENVRKPSDWASALYAAAEAQSGVRLACTAVGFENDRDQLRAFHWLRATARNEMIYLRHMSKDDPPDLDDIPSLRDRIRESRDALARIQQRERDHDQLLKRVQYHARRVLPENHDPRGVSPTHTQEWDGLERALQAWADANLAPSDVSLREVLLPLAQVIPDGRMWSDAADLAWREVLEHIERESERIEESAPVRQVPEHVREAAALLRGRTVALIGGVPRVDAQIRLKRDLELEELIWVETRAHQSTSPFEPVISRPEVNIVLLAIRWASHSFSEIDTLCARLEKPLVRLPRGYNPSEVARQILAQASGKLASLETAE